MGQYLPMASKDSLTCSSAPEDSGKDRLIANQNACAMDTIQQLVLLVQQQAKGAARQEEHTAALLEMAMRKEGYPSPQLVQASLQAPCKKQAHLHLLSSNFATFCFVEKHFVSLSLRVCGVGFFLFSLELRCCCQNALCYVMTVFLHL